MSDNHRTPEETETNRLWNDLVSGDVGEGGYDIPERDQAALRELQKRASWTLPDSARERAWQRTLSQIERNQFGEEPMNAVSVAAPGERMGAGYVPEAPAVAPHERVWRMGQLASAALLVLAIGIGYLVFDRFQSEPGRGTTIPAAIQTNGDLASNPVVGVWRLVDTPNDSLGDGIGLFHPDGSYTEVNVKTTFLGMWRVSGENTVEVFSIRASLGQSDVPYIDGTEQYFMSYTYDPATDTISGYYTPSIFDGQGTYLMGGVQYPQDGTRVSFDTILNPATPTP